MAASPVSTNGESFELVRASARAGALDRYLAALLAPRAVREDLVALAAFASEIEKIILHVNDAPVGEIRIQWWRDTLRDGAQGQHSGNPIADAFARVIARHDLPFELIDDHLDAASHSLFAPPENDDQLRRYLDLTQGVLFALAGRILGASNLAPSDRIVHSASQSYGLVRIGLTLPYALACGRNPLPPSLTAGGEAQTWQDSMTRVARDVRMQLEHASAAFAAESRAVRTALLPLALVEPYLRVLTRTSRDPTRNIEDIAPFTRVQRLLGAYVRGRI